MAYTTKGSPPANRRVALLANLKLARWEARQTAGLLLITGLGILLAVIIVCALPLYAQVAVSAGIREVLKSADGGPYMTVSSTSYQIKREPIAQVQQQITQQLQTSMGSFVSARPQFSIQLNDLPIVSSPRFYINSQFNLIGTSPQDAVHHLTLLQGRLPVTTSKTNDIEIAILPQAAKALGVTVGSKLPIEIFNPGTDQAASPAIPAWEAGNRLNAVLHVVGIFTLPAHTDPYWHLEDFQTGIATHCKTPCPPPATPPLFQALVSNDTLMNTFGGVATGFQDSYGGISNGPVIYSSIPLLYWYYPLNVSQINIGTFGPLVDHMKSALNNLSSSPTDNPYVLGTQAVGPYTPLLTYRNYVYALLVPATGITVLLLALVLYFVSVMMNLLVERRGASIATLRSRGANRRQILGLFAAQASGLSLVALVPGPILAVLAVYLLVQTSLPPSEQSALNLLAAQPRQVAAQLLEYALGTVVIALIAMLLALYHATGVNVLTMRRASARTGHVPFWQRARLDVIAAVLALAGYIAVIYIASPGVLGVRARVVALAPLTLAGAVCLILAAILLFLRGFPLFIELLSRVAIRGRSAPPTLALAQMARAPERAVRTMMLLAFATAFVIFALVFSGSQAQRLRDATIFQVGSDFSGDISILGGNIPSSAFSRRPGVAAAATGYVATNNVTNQSTTEIQLLAVDANSFAQAIIWPGADSAQSPAALLERLVKARSSATTTVPAIVDAAAANTMHLSIGSHFSLTDNNGKMDFVVVGEVPYIPTVIDSIATNDTGENAPAGGVLVDFQTYNTVAGQVNSVSYTSTTVWVRAKNTPGALEEVRREMQQTANTVTVENLNDSAAIATSLQSDPLYLALLEILISGAIAALLLALIGNLVASWQNARNRLTSFAVLRALGGARRQIASVLLWEQGIVYTTALALGLLFGVLLSLLALPTLIFTNAGSGVTGSTAVFYTLQSVPPIQVVIPWTLWLALAALILVCAVAVWMMVRIVSRPSMSQTLRLNED